MIEERKITGLMGRSGSGKSTLLKLLMRFWEVQKGSVTISGKQISSVNTDNLRRLESYVTQETQLFQDSILNNIRIAKLDAAREEVEEACKRASVHDFIMKLPKGYDTEIGELGDTLSGGEKQRIRYTIWTMEEAAETVSASAAVLFCRLLESLPDQSNCTNTIPQM